jgi:hypothetical protein
LAFGFFLASWGQNRKWRMNIFLPKILHGVQFYFAKWWTKPKIFWMKWGTKAVFSSSWNVKCKIPTTLEWWNAKCQNFHGCV